MQFVIALEFYWSHSLTRIGYLDLRKRIPQRESLHHSCLQFAHVLTNFRQP